MLVVKTALDLESIADEAAGVDAAGEVIACGTEGQCASIEFDVGVGPDGLIRRDEEGTAVIDDDVGGAGEAGIFATQALSACHAKRGLTYPPILNDKLS